MDKLFGFFVQQPLHILSVSCVWFVVWALPRFTQGSASHRVNALLVPAVAWLAYAAWEWLVLLASPEANIRVDLLLIAPFLGIATVWPLIRALRPERSTEPKDTEGERHG